MTLIQALPGSQCQLGESPFWQPGGGVGLFWCDIPGRQLLYFKPGSGVRRWDLPAEPGCIAPCADGRLMVSMRTGVYRFDTHDGTLELVAEPPYDPKKFRFNDGRADPAGRFFAGTIFEPRTGPEAGLYALQASDGGHQMKRVAGEVGTANGLAFSNDGSTMYWSDTRAHRIDCFDYDVATASPTNRRTFVQFPTREQTPAGQVYGGRPDGACIDSEGYYWVAMYEGGRLLRIAPDGKTEREIRLPVTCPTMCCFGGPEMNVLFVTTAREGRPDAEVSAEPLSGSVLQIRTEFSGPAVSVCLQ